MYDALTMLQHPTDLFENKAHEEKLKRTKELVRSAPLLGPLAHSGGSSSEDSSSSSLSCSSSATMSLFSYFYSSLSDSSSSDNKAASSSSTTFFLPFLTTVLDFFSLLFSPLTARSLVLLQLLPQPPSLPLAPIQEMREVHLELLL